MVSRMAEEDCEELLAQGKKLTFRDMIRLNALGVRAERGPNSVSFYALPRCVFLGDLCFREPTIGHEIWFDDVSRQFDLESQVTEFALRAFMMSRSEEDLPSPTNLPEVKYQLDKFVHKTISKLTVGQLTHAMTYCTCGCDPIDGEEPPVPLNIAGDEDIDVTDTSIAIGVVREGQALGLGISLADAKKMTRSALQDVVMRAYKLREIDVSGSVKQECIGDYLATLAEIKNRLDEEEKAAKDG